MRVGIVSSYDISGGAGRAAYRLHRGLIDAGIDSKMFVGAKASADSTVQLIPSGKNIAAKVRRRLRYGRTARIIRSHARSIANGHDVFSSDRIPGATSVAEHLQQCDVIHLHWISWFIDWEDFFPRLTPVPIVWTLHDMNTFTGGCHYDAGCGRYKVGCGQCPALESSSPVDLSSRIFHRKSPVLSAARLHITAPSRWLTDAAQASPLLKQFQCSVIPNGLDLDLYKPLDKAICRQELNIPVHAKVVLFVADSNENKRKGFLLLTEALAMIGDIPDLLLVSIGGAAHGSYRSLGQVTDEHRLAAIYSAADVLVIPSLQDNLPNTVLEAMACGLPSVGFDVGGIPDMIVPGSTGYLAPRGDIAAFADAIRRMLNDPNPLRFRENCRQRATEEFDVKIQARRFIELYRRISFDH